MSINESDQGERRRSKRILKNYESEFSYNYKKSKKNNFQKVESVKTPEKDVNDDYKNFLLCEKCGKKFKITNTQVDETSNTCRKCLVKLANKSNENEQFCENCKESLESSTSKSFGCLICMKYYHIDCLLESDLPENIKFNPGQSIRRVMGCLRCYAENLPYKVNSIINWKWREVADKVSNPEKYYMPREFFIHYRNKSYWDCEWVSEIQLEISENQLYRCYKRKVKDFNIPPGVHILTDNHKRRYSKNQIQIHDSHVKWGIDPEWLQPQKVLDMDEFWCLVKWKGLGYEYVTTEPLSRVSSITDLKEVIDRHQKFAKEITEKSWCPRDKSDLRMLNESPSYFGPLIVTGKERPSLYSYQLEGLNWLRSCYSNGINTILADEMGLGKTIQAIGLLYSLYKEKISRGPFLIVVPLTTIKNWEREFEFWAPELCILSYYGDKDARVFIRSKDMFYQYEKRIPAFHVLLTTYELVVVDEKQLNCMNWEVLIIDEAQRIKNSGTKLFKALKDYSTSYRLLLTGTPLQNNLEELFNLLNFMEPKSFQNLEAFLSQFEDVSKEEQVRTLQEMIKKHVLRRMKNDVFKNLPSKEEKIILVELTPFQKNLYKLIFTKSFDVLKGRYNGIRLSNIIMQLRKCCNHPYLFKQIGIEHRLKDWSFDVPELISASGKMIVIQKMLIKLKETGHKVLIFSGMTKLLDLMEYLLEYMDLEYERIDGSFKSIERQTAIDRFNDPDSTSMVFLLSTKAGGLGINLCAADTVFIYDPDWNPQNDIQALSRSHRIGQTKKVMIYRFVTKNSIEEKVMERAKRKMMITNLVVKSFTKAEFHQILSFGTKELFEETADTQKITYDEEAIENLLRRDGPEEINSETSFLDSCFSGFKVAEYQFANDINERNDNNASLDSKDKIEETIIDNPEQFWTSILQAHVDSSDDKEKQSILPKLGKGLRQKKRINYFAEKVSKQLSAFISSDDEIIGTEQQDDTDYDISEGENMKNSSSSEEAEVDEEANQMDDNGSVGDNDCLSLKPAQKKLGYVENGKSSSKYNLDRDFKNLYNYDIITPNFMKTSSQSDLANDNDVIQKKYFSIISGFLPKERFEIYNALMNFGLPPKVLKRGNIWWPSSLEYKTTMEMNKFICLLMINLTEYDANSCKNNQIIQDDIDFKLLLCRIGVMGLINYKVNQYEISNKTILEIVTHKKLNVKTSKKEEVVEIFDELKYLEFDFDILEGGFTDIHDHWNSYNSTIDKGNGMNPTLVWNKLHDYFLLSAIATHGYNNFVDHIFDDPQYQILLIPSKMENINFHKENSEIRKFIRNRQRILENALLLEAQLMKVASVFVGDSIDFTNMEDLKYYHDFFAKQNKNNYVCPALTKNIGNQITAIAQLEQLINDVECDSETYKVISMKQD